MSNNEDKFQDWPTLTEKFNFKELKNEALKVVVKDTKLLKGMKFLD